MIKVLKTLKGGSLSRTEVIWDGFQKLVRKSIATDTNREYGLVRWQSQIRKLQLLNKFIPEHSVPINFIGNNDNFYFYDMPYYEHHINCYEALIQGESESIIADKIHLLLSKLAQVRYKPTKGALHLYIAEEIMSSLDTALQVASSGVLPMNKQELNFFKSSITEAIEIVKIILQRVINESIHESLTHGNLTLENLLWNTETKELLMIDPYAETYCESIIGDVSQILQSTQSGYELISDLFENSEISIEEYPADKIPKCLINFSHYFLNRISGELWFSKDYLIIFQASQFIRMFPFKIVKAPRQGVAFLIHGINLLRTFKC